jgi:hypothetical protein
MVTFSNPRLRAELADYPIGAGKRGLCVFEVKFVPKKGYKFFRTTTGKPKSDIAYGGKAAIVDGDNGRTYLLQRGTYGGITIYRSDMKCAETEVLGFDHYVTDREDVFATLNALIEAANAPAN